MWYNRPQENSAKQGGSCGFFVILYYKTLREQSLDFAYHTIYFAGKYIVCRIRNEEEMAMTRIDRVLKAMEEKGLQQMLAVDPVSAG